MSIPQTFLKDSAGPGTTSLDVVWKPGSLLGAAAIAEAIAAKDLNNLYRTSSYFRDPERYRAFCSFYAVMRIVDDRVDALMGQPRVTGQQIRQERRVLEAWHGAVSARLAGGAPSKRDTFETNHPEVGTLLQLFADALRLFPVPAVLWHHFFRAMRRDLTRQRFATFGDFLEYAEGAAVAPTTVYLYLIAADRCGADDVYRPPSGFDLIGCGRELGRFAYIAHILRDLPDDLSAGFHGRLYLAAEDMAKHGVTDESLADSLTRRSSDPRLRALVRDLADRARCLVERGRARMQILDGRLSPDRSYVLELIVRLYEAVLEKIVSHSYDVMTDRHRLTDAEKLRIGYEVATSRASCPRP